MLPPKTTHTVAPLVIEDRQAERSDKSESTALEILKIAVEATKAKHDQTANELAAFAETLWQWTTSDTWPPKP